MWEHLWIGGHAATMIAGATPYGVVRDAAVASKDGRIAFVGSAAELPGAPTDLARAVTDVAGAWITPGLIDCHTHLVYAGDRAEEWERRLNGATYEEIARAGGGILSTVKATRAASADELVAQSRPRLDALMGEGVTTAEIKSGYGLTVDDEMKMLMAAGRLCEEAGVRVSRTLLGAHALPPEFADDRTGYVRLVCEEMIPRAANESLADAVDVFCENIGFTADESAAVFDAAAAHGLKIKVHAEQLSDQGGAALAARRGALSADHLERLSDDGIAAMAQAGTVAVLLPGAYYFLNDDTPPPVDMLRAAGVAMAVATDCNPGSSPVTSPLMMMSMACTLFGMTPEEALAGFTLNAARALGMQDEIGTLHVGKVADLAIWNVGSPAELSYWIGANPLKGRVVAGVPA